MRGRVVFCSQKISYFIVPFFLPVSCHQQSVPAVQLFLEKRLSQIVLKLIPVVGTAAGGAISGATAGLLTTALGEAYISLMDMMYRGEIKANDLYGEKGESVMKSLFKEELKKSGNKTTNQSCHKNTIKPNASGAERLTAASMSAPRTVRRRTAHRICPANAPVA